MMTLQNALATAGSNSCLPTLPLSNTALVAEGGGQRGIFTAGVLDSWLYKGFNPFDLLIGTSAGAQNLSSYMACQKGFGQRSIMQLSKHSNFFKFHRALVGRSAVDLDWYFSQVEQHEHNLNVDCALTRLKARRLLFSATKVSDRRAEFFEPKADNWLTMLKASSALPILYKKGVKIGQEYYVDGGLSAPLPVEEAYRRGAKKIIAIRTVPKDFSAQSPWAHKLKSWVCNSNRCPKVIDLITHHENAYQKTLSFIDNPPEGVQVIQVFPEKSLSSSLVGSSYESLNKDYTMGVNMGLAFLKQHSSSMVAPSAQHHR